MARRLARAHACSALAAAVGLELLLAVGPISTRADVGRAGLGSVGSSGGAALLGVEETEAFVRRIDYEGMPEDEAARIGPAGVARLLEMLEDPAERAHQARILLALGSAGGADALAAIRSWLDALPNEGELDRASFRAWQNLPLALARLARREPEAVAELVARFDAAPPGWSFRQFRGERLRQLGQRAALTALAETRRPEAARALEALARRPHPPALAEHLRAMQAEMQQAMQQAMQEAMQGAADRSVGTPVETGAGSDPGGVSGSEP